ncbi:MAG: hypothetical protein WA253_06440 [Gammaproteobacteria bacterium]
MTILQDHHISLTTKTMFDLLLQQADSAFSIAKTAVATSKIPAYQGKLFDSVQGNAESSQQGHTKNKTSRN